MHGYGSDQDKLQAAGARAPGNTYTLEMRAALLAWFDRWLVRS